MKKKVLFISIVLLLTSASSLLFAKSSLSVGPYIDKYIGLELSELYKHVTLQVYMIL